MLLSILFFTGVGVVGHRKSPAGASDGIQLNLVPGTDKTAKNTEQDRAKKEVHLSLELSPA